MSDRFVGALSIASSFAMGTRTLLISLPHTDPSFIIYYYTLDNVSHIWVDERCLFFFFIADAIDI
jgi:hypothetical protein